MSGPVLLGGSRADSGRTALPTSVAAGGDRYPRLSDRCPSGRSPFVGWSEGRQETLTRQPEPEEAARWIVRESYRKPSGFVPAGTCSSEKKRQPDSGTRSVLSVASGARHLLRGGLPCAPRQDRGVQEAHGLDLSMALVFRQRLQLRLSCHAGRGRWQRGVQLRERGSARGSGQANGPRRASCPA